MERVRFTESNGATMEHAREDNSEAIMLADLDGHFSLNKSAVGNGRTRVNPFPNDKILEQTKLKACADEKLDVTKIRISVFDRVENIVGKG